MNRQIEEKAEKALLRSQMYQGLGAALLYPDKEFSVAVTSGRLFEEIERLLRRVLGSESEHLADEWVRIARKGMSSEDLVNAYQEVFTHTISQVCPPCEMEYERTHVFQLTQQLADLSGFYKAFGAQPVEKSGERVDHFSVEMEFMSWLTLKETYFIQEQKSEPQQIIVDGQRKFFKDHLGRWAPLFLQKVIKQQPPEFYRLVADAALLFLEFERNLLGVVPQELRDTDFQSTPEFEEEPICGLSESCSGF